ncbi:peptidase inhibitor family I36 protein [Streptomyces acidicola]|uniref:peptidase inhibitor family I36 protein n=1 Tax=Streptomyces acidicola TaxID=2596892 RepID=UPI003805DBD8
MRTMRMVLVGVGSAALLATGGTMTAGAASQGVETQASAPSAKIVDPQGAAAKGVDANVAWDCARGAVCFYTKADGGGTKHERFADTDKNIYGIRSAWNNGFTSESLDHVKIKWNYTGSSKSHYGCLSPNERWRNKKSFTVDAIRWVKSC